MSPQGFLRVAASPFTHTWSAWRAWRLLSRLSMEMEDASRRLSEAQAKARQKKLKGNDHGEFMAEHYNEYDIAQTALDAELHNRLLRRAYRYRVPVPPRLKDSHHWEETWMGWQLTEAAAYELRREVATEAEMAQRPWLNWLSLVFSGAGLAVAILALVISLGGGDVSPPTPLP